MRMADLLFALLAYVTANLKQEIICCKAEEAREGERFSPHSNAFSSRSAEGDEK
jgi:hypothetical protein